jgi:hypothetical protein
MSKPTTLEERLEIWTLAQLGWTDRQIAEEVGWSEHTVRKWRRKQERAGRAGVVSDMGRPARGSMSTFGESVRETLQRWRSEHPGWGPKTLHAELRKDPASAGQRLPSPASIGRYLKAQRLSRGYEKHGVLLVPDRAPATTPHAIWEMDARGYSRVPEVGIVSLIDLNDRCSHVRLLSYPVWVGSQRCQRHPTTDDYQTALRLAFTDWGLPQQLQVDHEAMFADNTSKSPFPTRLHLWLLALGIDLLFGRRGRPTDQGLTERSHQLWAAQCLQGACYPDWLALYQTLRQRRDFLNRDLPCASLDNLPPLRAWPTAAHSGRPYRPEAERDLLDLRRVWAYLAQGRWFRKVSVAYTFQLGGQVYYAGTPWQFTQLEITFDPTDQHLVARNEAGDLVVRCPLQAVTPLDLMGSLAPALTLPIFQLALPFSWADSYPVRLLETLPV